MQMPQSFNEFAWLVHVGLLDGVLKNQIQGVCCTTINNLTLRVYLLLRHSFFKSEFKKRIALICFIEITSILAHAKTQLNQAVKPYSFNVVKRRGF